MMLVSGCSAKHIGMGDVWMVRMNPNYLCVSIFWGPKSP